MKVALKIGSYQLQVNFTVGFLCCFVITGIVEFYEWNYSYNIHSGLFVALNSVNFVPLVEKYNLQSLGNVELYNIRKTRRISLGRCVIVLSELFSIASLFLVMAINGELNLVGHQYVNLNNMNNEKVNLHLCIIGTSYWFRIWALVNPIARLVCTFAFCFTFCTVVATASNRSKSVTTKALRPDTEATEDQQQCAVCKSNRVRVCLPCGHFILCHGCYAQTKASRKCFMCNKGYDKGIKVFVDYAVLLFQMSFVIAFPVADKDLLPCGNIAQRREVDSMHGHTAVRVNLANSMAGHKVLGVGLW